MDRFLVFAPHPDDEVLGCGGLLALRAGDSRLRVVVVTSGGAGGDPAVRRQETLAGLTHLGVADCVFWEFPDGGLPLFGPIRARYRDEVAGFRPSRIFLPSPFEAHPDHRRLTRGLLAELEGRWQGELCFYETMQPLPTVNVIIDVSSAMDKVMAALAEHASQLAGYDYRRHRQGLSALRGAAKGYDHGEAYLAYPWDGSPQNFFEGQPLVSVIVRASRAHFLQHALNSLLRQDYDLLQVVVVWFGEGEPDLASFAALDLMLVEGRPNRSLNLNLGLDHSRGAYVAFLDEDDIVHPAHLALLVAELNGAAEVDIAYSGCRVVSCHVGDGGAVQVLGGVETLSRPYARGRLLVGNYIPLNALLFRRQVFHGHRFDEALGAYEDWDMLARLELAGRHFAHVDEVTCEYRLYPEEGQEASLEAAHRARDYPRWRQLIVDRLAAGIRGDQLESVLQLVDRQETRGDALAKEVNELKQQCRHLERLVASRGDADAWLRRVAALQPLARAGDDALRHLAAKALSGPLISIILPVCDPEPELLSEALASVACQSYPRWELCLVDDASLRADIPPVLERFAGRYADRVRLLRRQERGGIVAASNDALALASGEYAAFLDHDDRLNEHCLAEIALSLAEDGSCDLLYTDSRTIDLTGDVVQVYRKADFGPESLLHLNYINHLVVVRRELLSRLGNLDGEFEGAQDWDILLRLSTETSCPRHLALPLYDWRMTPGSTSYAGADAKPWAWQAAIAAVGRHLQRIGLKAAVAEANPDGPGVACRWESDWRPITAIVPTHNNATGLRSCLQGLLEVDYPELDVIVVLNRADEATRAVAEEFSGPRLRLLVDDAPFNWAALNNRAVAQTTAPWLLFVNDDVEMKDRGWLKAMARYFEFMGVTTVGATLYYPDGDLQHNGIFTDPEWVAGNITSLGVRGELAVTRNVSAVTGACLLTRRETFDRVEGFDERFASSYNDVDYCLYQRMIGGRVVQVMEAKLVHHESRSRGRPDNPEKESQWQEEMALMRDKWRDMLVERFLPRYELAAAGSRILTAR